MNGFRIWWRDVIFPVTARPFLRCVEAWRGESVIIGALLVVLGAAVRANVVEAQAPAVRSPEQIAVSGRPTTVTILALDAAGDTLSQGSGVIIRADGVVVTNWHVLRGASSALVRTSDGEVHTRVLFLDGDSTADIAMLRVAAIGLRAARTTIEVPPPGARVVVIGAPLGLSQTVSDGLISAVRLLEGKTIVQLTAAISHGSSGGPVFDNQGRVFAIATSTLEDGQSLNFAMPIRYALALLPLNTPPRPIAAAFADGGTSPRRATPATSARESRETREVGSIARMAFPPKTKDPSATIAGTYIVRHERGRGAGADPIRTGLIVIDDSENGVFLYDRVDGNAAGFMFSVVTTQSGRVGFSMFRNTAIGYQTDSGFVAALPFDAADTVRLVATAVDLALVRPDGLYDVKGRTRLRFGDGKDAPSPTDWTGTAAVVTTADSLWMIVALGNASGGGAIEYVRTSVDAQGRFAWTSTEGSQAIGSVRGAVIDFDWVEARKDNVSYRGHLRGTRR